MPNRKPNNNLDPALRWRKRWIHVRANKSRTWSWRPEFKHVTFWERPYHQLRKLWLRDEWSRYKTLKRQTVEEIMMLYWNESFHLRNKRFDLLLFILLLMLNHLIPSTYCFSTFYPRLFIPAESDLVWPVLLFIFFLSCWNEIYAFVLKSISFPKSICSELCTAIWISKTSPTGESL